MMGKNCAWIQILAPGLLLKILLQRPAYRVEPSVWLLSPPSATRMGGLDMLVEGTTTYRRRDIYLSSIEGNACIESL
jgi:hypothetical protein